MVADRHRLAAYQNKHSWRAFRGYQHWWPWTTLNPKIWLLSDVCYFRLRRTLRLNFRWNILEIDQDNLRTKLNWCCRASHELRFLVLSALASRRQYCFQLCFSVNTITHEPLHSARWHFARTCTLTTSTTLLNFKVILKGQGHMVFVRFSLHDAAATRGQYLADLGVTLFGETDLTWTKTDLKSTFC